MSNLIIQQSAARQKVNAIGLAAEAALTMLSVAAQQTFADVWYRGRSPQQFTRTTEQLAAMTPEELAARDAAMQDFRANTAALLAEMGTAAADAFAQHARTISFLVASGRDIPASYYTPPFAYTVHGDGTVTLND